MPQTRVPPYDGPVNLVTQLSHDSSRRTLEALAQVIRALAPEVCSVSFHDVSAETLWMSDDFLRPEDHQLVGQLLSRSPRGTQAVHYGRNIDARYSVALSASDAEGMVNGAVRLSVDARVADARVAEPLEHRLAPVLVCVAAELERRQAVPQLPGDEAERLAEIERALHAKRFELFLQPIRSLQGDLELSRYEVLLRLRMFDGTLLEPGAFLRTAAYRGLMPTIDRWVVRNLLVWMLNNRDRWARLPAVFSVNLAWQSVTDASFVSYVESCVQKSRLPPQALCFEVTERFASSGSISLAESLQRLEALGCEVALDDFGTAAPSYGYLRGLPAHYFKIDASLVLAAPTDRVARAVISSIVCMAGDLGIQTVAESVESNSELEAMRTLGVDFAQGYLVGRPGALTGYDFDGPPGMGAPAH
jgi:EAL domain-containing protein (putative c-di-GMP-specific phosphodiesterase class I)